MKSQKEETPEKPDFEAMASSIYYEHHEKDTDAILVIAMERIWNDYVASSGKVKSDPGA